MCFSVETENTGVVITGPLSCVFLCGQGQVWGHNRAVVVCYVKTETGVWSQLGRCRVFSCEDRDRYGVTTGPLPFCEDRCGVTIGALSYAFL